MNYSDRFALWFLAFFGAMSLLDACLERMHREWMDENLYHTLSYTLTLIMACGLTSFFTFVLLELGSWIRNKIKK